MDVVNMITIISLYKENIELRKKIVALKYNRSDKGYEKVQRNNEKRRNKTKFKRVLRELNHIQFLFDP